MKEKRAKQTPEMEDVAELAEGIMEEVLNTQGLVRDVEANLTAKIQESEGHLLDAIRGIEVRRQDFDAVREEVKVLAERVERLEEKRRAA